MKYKHDFVQNMDEMEAPPWRVEKRKAACG